MKKIVLLCFLLLLTFGNTASAANWQYVMTAKNGDTLFFDSDTLKVNEYKYLDVWTKCVLSPKANSKVAYQIYHVELSQTPRCMKFLSFYSYSANNKFIGQHTIPSSWDEIIPGTYSEAFYRKIVQYYKDKVASDAQQL